MSAGNSTDRRLGWQSSPNAQGTIDIIWGCMLTIFLCVWTVLTLNVPARDTTKWAFTRTKIKWATIALFGPEWLSGMAGAQWSIARRAKKQFRDEGIEWTMRQSFFADMGGVRVNLKDDEFPVTSKHIYVLFKLGLIKLDAINPAVIEDRSKADGVAKLFTIVQTAWFILQCLARLIQHISITTLELSTIAFVVCTIGTNIMWWAKPKDVSVPVILKIDCTLESLLAMAGPQILDAKSEAVNWKWSPLEKFDDLRPNFLVDVGQYLPYTRSFKLSQASQKIRFRNDRFPPLERDWALGHFLSVLSLSFGAVYVAGWNISFPTRVELIVWRICTVMLFSLVVAFWAVDAGVELHERKKKVAENQKVAVTPVKMALYAVIAVVYVTIRIYILIEPFVCLRSLPAVAFKTVEWSSFIPHF
ncbi:hypothetical protein OEA41_007421 [Lepraria neglecta]|uniref:Uncharacterized protein n=1 Tax=Lepraria neglecta TaxID=209136 RepID=A0AAE0DN20_9LECA|nr:hypothetical protein OEA41_007421 [Lepraria neglecta]